MSEWIDPHALGEGDPQRSLHLGRYRWAAEMVKGYAVANAACSCNYGAPILAAHGRLVVGFDRNPDGIALARSTGNDVVVLKDIQGYSFEGFDALVTLETFEHLERPWEFLAGLSPTVRELVLSTPVIPTKHFNEWHLHDFTEKEVLDGLKGLGWKVERTAYQDEEGLQKPTYILVYAKR